MRTLNLVLMDIRNGISVVWYRGMIAGAMFILVNISLYRLSGTIVEHIAPLSLGDYYVNTFTGIKWSEFRPDRLVVLPFMWLTVILSILYFTLHYTYKDLEGIGKHLIVLSGSRLKWWYTKCLWVFFTVLLFFFSWLVVTVIWFLVTQGNLDFTISSNISIFFGLRPEMMTQPPWAITDFIIVTFLMILALCMLQMLVTLYLSPILSFISSISILILSIHINNPFMIGNYLMATRSKVFVFSGFDSVTGIVISIGIIITVIFLGGHYFKNMDILVKED